MVALVTIITMENIINIIQADYDLLRSQTPMVWRVAKKTSFCHFKKTPEFLKSLKLLLLDQHPKTLQEMALH